MEGEDEQATVNPDEQKAKHRYPVPRRPEEVTVDETTLLAERIERAALLDLHRAVSEQNRCQLGMGTLEVNGALLSVADREPRNILVNRVLGLGLERPARAEDIETIRARYREAGVEEFFLHLHPQARPAQLRGWLEDAGLVRTRSWMKFSRDLSPPPQLQSELRVEPIGPEHAEDFARIVAFGFDFTDAALPCLAALVGRPDWHIYMSFAGDQPAGTGALLVRDGIGWLDWAATHPDHRRKGGQGALLARRIRDAAELGCRMLFTATGEEVPGDPQHSYKNILRVGFQEAYLRENYAPPL
ncbi:MAG: GNAT family N-acetyltransferase [Candidatus Competibacteraceae bacterium]|nr:GNAT family N-acetyltransferase [Candidatus Competibacteraceae bacterium]